MALPVMFVIKRKREILHKWHRTSWREGNYMGKTVCGFKIEHLDDRNMLMTRRFKNAPKCKRCFG